MNKNILKTALILSLAAMSSNVFAANTSEIEKLEKEFISIENQLLVPELRLDELNKERSEYDSFTGWFKFGKKKALDAEIEQKDAEAKKLANDLNKINKDIQSKVFEVAQSFEANGNYDKAIEFYMKVVNPGDKVRERLAACYKGKKDYTTAIKWLLAMNRTDSVMLEVADCCHLDKKNKDTIYWLFQILEPYDGNSAEKSALKLIETYKYADLKVDYPDFYTKLSNIYIKKAFAEFKDNSASANASYKKAVDLIVEDTGKTAVEVSCMIVNDYQKKYAEALEILTRQQTAAVRNYEDKVKTAEEEIYDAKRALNRAHGNAERHYQQEVKSAEDNLRRAEDRLRAVEAKADATDSEKGTAKLKVNEARNHLSKVMHDRERIMHDYIRPYERRLKDAIYEKDKIVMNREKIIEDYVAPFKKDVEEAKRLQNMIKNMHSSNF